LEAREKWDNYYRKNTGRTPQACQVLAEYGYLLPSQGTALDLACGIGGNALYLAECGLQTTAVDVSSVALDSLTTFAAIQAVEINTVQQELDEHFFADDQYDVITVSAFLDRQLFTAIQRALKPGGLLFYQTFVKHKADTAFGPSRPDYLLGSNELLTLLPELIVLVYFDLGTQGDVTRGLRNQSCLVAQRPVSEELIS